MEQERFERWTLLLIAAGIILAIAEFLVVSLVIGHGNIVGFQNGALAGAGVVAASVVLVWMATFFLKPGEEQEMAAAEQAEEAAQ